MHRSPQWSPGLMAGGSRERIFAAGADRHAAMEPRPDGRGKDKVRDLDNQIAVTPQWSPGLMAGGRSPASSSRGAAPCRRNGAPA